MKNSVKESVTQKAKGRSEGTNITKAKYKIHEATKPKRYHTNIGKQQENSAYNLNSRQYAFVWTLLHLTF